VVQVWEVRETPFPFPVQPFAGIFTPLLEPPGHEGRRPVETPDAIPGAWG